MKQLTFFVSAWLVLGIFTAASCNKNRNTDKNNISCTNVLCTDLFAMVTVKVVDSNNAPVQLTDLYTLRSGTGQVIRPGQDIINGSYDVLDDGYISHLRNDSDTFIFTAIHGTDTVRASFVIGADCCHVRKISGPESVTMP